MKIRALLLLLALTVLGACSTARPASSSLPGATVGPGASGADHVASMNSSRDIVLAVANPQEPPPTHAGSSMLGYAPPATSVPCASRLNAASSPSTSLLASWMRPCRSGCVVSMPVSTMAIAT